MNSEWKIKWEPMNFYFLLSQPKEIIGGKKMFAKRKRWIDLLLRQSVDSPIAKGNVDFADDLMVNFT